MKLRTPTYLLLAVVVLANVGFARKSANPSHQVQTKQLTLKTEESRSARTISIPMDASLTREERIQLRHNYLKNLPQLTKEQLIRQAHLRNAIKNGEEPKLDLSAYSDEFGFGIDAVPGGGDIFDTWHVSFDTEADFLTFDTVTYVGSNNEWLWFDYTPSEGEEYRYLNSAIAPEPGPDGLAGSVLEAKEQAIEIKVGVAKESENGDPYRVASLLVDLWLEDPDYDGDGDGWLDDYMLLEILEEPKWHLDTFGSHTTDQEVWYMGDHIWDNSGYHNEWLQYLDTNPVDLTGASAPVLTFKTAWSSEDEWDGGTVLVSTDAGATWAEVTPDGDYPSDYIYAFNYHWNDASDSGIDFGEVTAGNHGGYTGHEGHVGDNWTDQSIALSSFIGETVIVRFAFASEAGYSPAQSGFDGGWWLDAINVADGGDNLVTALTPTHEGAGYTGDKPWLMLDYYYDTKGGQSLTDSYSITGNIIGSFADSITVRFYAIFDDNNDGSSGGWGFEVGDVKLRVTTRFEKDAGATFVDLVTAGGDSVLATDGYALVGTEYDPITTIQNFGLTDIGIYNAFVEIENAYGDIEYQEFIYTYGPDGAMGDTLLQYPAAQDFNDDESFYNFPNWTPTDQGDYVIRAYVQFLKDDDEPEDDMIEIPFHVFNSPPTAAFPLDAADDSTLFAGGWTFEAARGDTSFFMYPYFGADNEVLWHTQLAAADTMDERLISPIVNLSGEVDHALIFEQHIWANAHPSWQLDIEGTVDGGTNWSTILSTTAASPYDARHNNYNLDLSAFDGEATFQLGIHLTFADTMAGPAPYGYASIDGIVIYPNADLTAPSAPSGVAATGGDLIANVTWTGGDADVMYYSVYASEYDHVDSSWHELDVSASKAAAVVDISENAVPFYFFVTGTDRNGNESVLSASAAATGADTTAPAAITDLYAEIVEDTLRIEWAAPYESGVDALTTYDIRYSLAPITAATFDTNTAVHDTLTPAVAAKGTKEQAWMPIAAPAVGGQVFVAIKTTDENSLVSALSNVANTDHIVPAQVTDLAVSHNETTDIITLTWTAPGDDDTLGTVASYDIRVAYTEPPFDFKKATVLDVVVPATEPGGTITVALDPASQPVYPDFKMSFALIASDDVGNESERSNIAAHGFEWLAVDQNEALPTTYSLRQNYPNPFNPETSIEFTLPEQAKVVLTIYNMLGQEVKRLEEGVLAAGYYRLVWDATDNSFRNLPSGIYFYRISSAKFNKTMKMVLLK